VRMRLNPTGWTLWLCYSWGKEE